VRTCTPLQYNANHDSVPDTTTCAHMLWIRLRRSRAALQIAGTINVAAPAHASGTGYLPAMSTRPMASLPIARSSRNVSLAPRPKIVAPMK
jgi:hypothetical protein